MISVFDVIKFFEQDEEWQLLKKHEDLFTKVFQEDHSFSEMAEIAAELLKREEVACDTPKSFGDASECWSFGSIAEGAVSVLDEDMAFDADDPDEDLDPDLNGFIYYSSEDSNLMMAAAEDPYIRTDTIPLEGMQADPNMMMVATVAHQGTQTDPDMMMGDMVAHQGMQPDPDMMMGDMVAHQGVPADPNTMYTMIAEQEVPVNPNMMFMTIADQDATRLPEGVPVMNGAVVNAQGMQADPNMMTVAMVANQDPNLLPPGASMVNGILVDAQGMPVDPNMMMVAMVAVQGANINNGFVYNAEGQPNDLLQALQLQQQQQDPTPQNLSNGYGEDPNATTMPAWNEDQHIPAVYQPSRGLMQLMRRQLNSQWQAFLSQ